MFPFFLVVIMALVVFITFKQLSIAFDFLAPWVTPLFWVFIALCVIFVVILVIWIIKKFKERG